MVEPQCSLSSSDSIASLDRWLLGVVGTFEQTARVKGMWLAASACSDDSSMLGLFLAICSIGGDN